MIFGVGVDIVKIARFERWAADKDMLSRFFNEEEMSSAKSTARLCEHYAARFAAKEAFSKALGTGLCGFALKDVYIQAAEDGAPHLEVTGTAREALNKRCGTSSRLYVSLSHEREYAVAFVVIEKQEER